MTHLTQSSGAIERRMGSNDRRSASERRNEERLSYESGEFRSSDPRRDMDDNRRLIEGELWWSKQSLF